MASGENHVVGVNLDSLVSSSSPNVSSIGQLDNASTVEDNTLTPELRSKVFDNELIRDHIFEYVFSSNDSSNILINEDVLRCRLVDHAWLDYITYRLQTSGSPEYTLDFEYSHESKEDQDRRLKTYQVHKFLDTWVDLDLSKMRPPPPGGRTPLFTIKITLYSKSAEFLVKSLIKCLTQCGRGLDHLTLDIRYELRNNDEVDVHCMNYVATTEEINLPNLTELEVALPVFHNAKPLVFLLLSRILSGCKRLTSLCLEDRCFEVSPWSRIFLEEEILSGKSEQLPNTLEKLEMNMSITTELLEKLLLENSLPKLSWLELRSRSGVDNDVLSRIIDRYSLQLNHIRLDGENSTANRVMFPVMAKLKDMCISKLHSEPQPEINQSFPILETLTLQGQTPSMMQKWTQNSHFSCVKELTVVLEASSMNLSGSVLTVKPLELSKQLHVAFPHVQKLEINFGFMCKLDDGSIQNIFQYMPQLCDLSLQPHILDYQGEAFTWDAILLGVTPEYAKTLAESPREEWDSINLNNHRSPSRSIVNLSRLTKFRLSDRIYRCMVKMSWGNLKISDLSFSFAFLRMPNLKTLTLDGGFWATQEMVCEWKRHGRDFCGRVQSANGEDEDMSTSEEEDYDINLSDEDYDDVVINEEESLEGGVSSVDGEDGRDSSVDGEEGGVSSVDGEEGGVSSVDGEEGGVSSVDGEEGGVTGVDGEEGGVSGVDVEKGGVSGVDGEGGVSSVDGGEGGRK